jgi:hypothetical protein
MRSESRLRNKVVSKPAMLDARMERMESEKASKCDVEEMCAGLSAQIQQLSARLDDSAASTSRNSRNKGTQGAINSKVAKLEFPRYDGTNDPTSWVCRVGQYFEFQNTEDENKVMLAAYHLEGEAQLWYQIFKEDEEDISWEKLKDTVHVRFGPTQFEDFYGDLSKLKQHGSVKEYQCQFEKLLSRVGKLSQADQVGGFVSGLKESIRIDVQAVKPSTLTAVVGLAKLYEARVLAKKKATFTLDSKPKFSQTLGSCSTQGFRNSNPPTRRLNEAEMKDRRERGLCFNCDEKFRPGHKCKKLFVIEGIYIGEEEKDDGGTYLSAEELEPTTEEFGVPEISLNALTGVSTPQTM